MSNLHRVQHEFAEKIRQGEHLSDNPDHARRLGVYQTLFYNNIDGFLQNGFPVIYRLLSPEKWHTLVRTFFTVHRSSTPYFSEISKEFLEFLSSGRFPRAQYPGWLPELAHYEWLELDVSIRRSSQVVSPERPVTDDSVLEISELASLASYSYPVHRIGPSYTPAHADGQQYFYCVFRNVSGDIIFKEINQATALVLNAIEESDGNMTLPQLVTLVNNAIPGLSENDARQALSAMLISLIEEGVVIHL